MICFWFMFFFLKQKTAYEMRISDWSSDVCSSDLSAAPSIRPGMSASTNSRCLCRTTPSWGRVVVKAYSPTLACALVTALMKVDLPALGSPTSPASASSLSRSEEHTSELQSLMRISYAVFCLKNKKKYVQKHQ